MSTYRKIHGRSIQAVTTDPTGDVAEGQVWYNTSSDTFKSVIASKAFVSSTPYPTAIFGNMGAGTQTAALSFGGTADPSTPSSPLVLTLEYNGSGWTTGGDMSQKRRNGFGFGTQTAALGSTGYTYPYTNKTEHYNGTSWTNGGNYPVSYELGGGCGTQTAGLACGGGPAPTNASFPGLSNEYDGSSWTASPGGLNTGRAFVSTVGTQTAGLAAGGANAPGATGATNCEEYNGSTWTTVNSLNTARARTSFGSGIQTAAISYGTPGSLESYDGTNWTNEPATMGNARDTGASAGTATASLAACGSPGAFTSHVEEYNVSTNVITAAAFASGGNLPAAWYGVGASQFGTQNSGLSFAGNNPGAYTGNTASFLYNGSSWTATPSMSTARAYLSGFGTSTSAVGAGGATGPGAKVTSTEEYDGSSWTNGGALGTARSTLASAGASITSGVVFGGAEPAASNKTEEYNGSSWTAVTAMPTSTADPGGNGIQTSALMVGGNTGPATVALEYDGTNWTAGGSTSVDHKKGGVLGSSSDSAIVCGGHTAPQTAVEGYDGTAWSTRPSMATARGRMANVGTASSGFVAGGNPSATNATEEWTGETTTLNVKTLTQS
jgi:hypothetical protein